MPRSIYESVYAAGGGVATFLELTDTPTVYTGQTLKGVRVNAGETALEFYTTVTTDQKVGIDSGATAGYLGAASNDGVLRTLACLTYTDGGDYVTLSVNEASVNHALLNNRSWSVAGHTIDSDIDPNASGSIDLGNVTNAWDNAWIDKVFLEADPATPLQAATKQYVDTEVAGVTESDTLEIVTGRGASTSNVIVPSASGTIDIGTVSLAFDDAHIDKVHLEGNPTTGLQATTKNYVDAQIAGITESDTLEIVTGRGATTSNVMTPDASGTVNLGTVALAFDEAFIDIVNLEADPTTTFQAANKGYVDDQIAGVSEVDTLQSVTDRGTTTSNVITPSASGSVDLGTIALAFDDAYIDKVHLEANPTTPLQAVTKQYVDAAMASSTPAGSDTQVQYNNGSVMGGAAGLTYNDGTQDVTFGGHILATASGTQEIGSISLAFSSGYIDELFLKADPTDDLQAATKQYVDDNAGGAEADTLETVTGRGATTSNVITPNASGTVDLGTVSLAFNDVYADRLNLEANPTTQFQAANKGYVDEQIAGVTESDTLEIVTGRGATTSNIITPDASGTVDLGTVSLAFDDAYIDKVHLEGNPITPREAATKQYVDDQDAAADAHITADGTSHANVVLNDSHRADNTQAHTDYLINTGDTIAGNLDPEASGTRSLGTVINAFDTAHIDKVYLEGDPSTGFEAATKNYVDDQVTGGAESDTLQTVTDRGAVTTQAVGTNTLTITNNSDTVVIDHDGTDAYMKWLDGSLYLMTDEGTNTDTLVRMKGKGTGGAKFILDYGDDANATTWYSQDINTSFMDFGTSTNSFTINKAGIDVDFIYKTLTVDDALVFDAGDDTASFGVNVLPSASGVVDLGSVPLAFDRGYIDHLIAASGVWAKEYYGDGSNLTGIGGAEADTLQSVTDRGATTDNSITTAGILADGAATFNEAGADVDFRVEGVGKTHAVYVNGANGNVGIGEVPDFLEIHLEGTYYSSAFPCHVYVNDETTAYNVTDNGGGIGFGAQYTSGGANTIVAAIQGAKRDNVDGDYKGDLRFFVRQDASPMFEAVRISATEAQFAGHIYPTIDDNYWLGKYDAAGPAWKGIVVADNVTGDKYAIQVSNGDLRANLIE